MDKKPASVENTVSSDDNFFVGLFKNFRAVITSPHEFFEHMPLHGGLLEPIAFVCVVAVCAAIGAFLRSSFNVNALMFEMLFWTVLSFVSAGYMQLLGRGFGGTGNFEGTYRAFAYAMAPGIFGWIPLVNLIAWLYMLYLVHLGLERAHGLPSNKTLMVIGIWFITFASITVVIGMMMMAVVVRSKSQVPGL
jgi:hypothetical protein